ncbi:MAG: YbbR-like domain-containing protein [Acidobacteria bacterium]|nr:YbbR-like domain-containing protein [Acidobacteriota bacterium]
MAYNPFRNLGLKVLAVLVAAGLWFVVAGEHVVERNMRVPLEFRNIPEGMEIVGDPPTAVDVRLRGSSGLLAKLQPGEVVAVLDLRGARRGMRLFHLQTDSVNRPYGVSVSHVQPPTLSLVLEPTSSRIVPVRPALEGEPAAGYVVRAVRSDPATVEIIGPEDHLRQTAEAITEPVNITDARAFVRDTVNIGVARTTVRLRTPQSARVVVEIVEAKQ